MKIKKPLIKDYCSKSWFSTPENGLILFDSKGYAKVAAKYIEQLEAEIKKLKASLK